MNSDDYIAKLKQIDFYKEGIHPELIPFVGNDYSKYKVLQIGESHYIPNYFEEKKDKDGTVHKANEIILDDFNGWWEGNYDDEIRKYIGWYNTRDVVEYYMSGERRKGHGIFTNTLKSFCKVVTPNESFDSITTANSQKYNYFAFMNFYQQPSIFEGENYTDSLYKAGAFLGKNTEEINKIWYETFDKSVEIVEQVIELLDPNIIIVTSSEVEKYYRRYGRIDESGNRKKGQYYDKDNIIWLDHPGSPWWYRKKKYDNKSSRERFEERLKELYSNTKL